MTTRKITNLQHISYVANSMFPCKVYVDPTTKGFGVRSDGKREVFLIVGWKINPRYNPNEPQGAAKHPRLPDERVIAVQAGIEEQELRDILQPIKDSLKNRQDTAMPVATQRPEPVNTLELAEELAAGKTGLAQGQEDEGDFDAGGAWEDDDAVEVPQAGQVAGQVENITPASQKEAIAEDNVMHEMVKDMFEGIQTLQKNMETIQEDIGDMNNRLAEVEGAAEREKEFKTRVKKAKAREDKEQKKATTKPPTKK